MCEDACLACRFSIQTRFLVVGFFVRHNGFMKYVVGVISILAALIIGWTVYGSYPGHMSEGEAIRFLKNRYPQYAGYPNTNLPPQSIRTEERENGWYVAFVQEGSGRPIIEAHCYFLENDKSIKDIGIFKPEGIAHDFDLTTCGNAGAFAADYKSAPFMIEGTAVTLVNGVAETEATPGSAKVVTRYFGNDLTTDLNGDGREDVVFLLTQNSGGSGTFFYVVGAVAREHGYAGTDGYLLGDRIAPQNITVSQNPRHKRVIVVNYADRAPGEPMTAQPSVGKSAYLKLSPTTMQWGIVEPDFEGEAR